MSAGLLFLGGNGHGPARLAAVRERLRRDPEAFELRELNYAAVDSYDALLGDLLEQEQDAPRSWPLYATGIGGLVALTLRSRGHLRGRPLVLQGAILWGLEARRFPRLMRIGPLARWVFPLFRWAPFQRRFARKHFRVPPSAELLRAFFAGYRDAREFATWFHWLTPDLLRALERDLAQDPTALEQLTLWWGERDSVVGPEEVRRSERALGVRLPLHAFADWGHYPMIDDPEGWLREVKRVVEDALQPA